MGSAGGAARSSTPDHTPGIGGSSAFPPMVAVVAGALAEGSSRNSAAPPGQQFSGKNTQGVGSRNRRPGPDRGSAASGRRAARALGRTLGLAGAPPGGGAGAPEALAGFCGAAAARFCVPLGARKAGRDHHAGPDGRWRRMRARRQRRGFARAGTGVRGAAEAPLTMANGH